MADKPYSLQTNALQNNVLQTIVDNKRDEVAQRKQAVPIADLIDNCQPSHRSLKAALSEPGNRFILEYKRASPSKGDIRPDFKVEDCLNAYSSCADAFSVLTDKQYFNGNHILLNSVAKRTNKPVLCKDFFIDEYQVYEARFYGADAILLMLSVLSDEQYKLLAKAASDLNLDVLTEVHSEQECQRAIDLNANIIGINNRDLTNLTTDLSNTERLSQLIPKDRIVISESGINTRADINRLAPCVNGFLVGSSLMAADEVAEAAKQLVYGNIKICGVTTVDIAEQAFTSGASYVGLMFYSKSVRVVTPEQAEQICTQVPGRYVGVFVNEDANTIADISKQCSLSAVQLHGYETEQQVSAVRTALNDSGQSQVEIWKALPLVNHNNIELIVHASRYADKVLVDYQSDSEQGGTGQSFDWSLLPELLKHLDEKNIIIAGGINADNVSKLFKFSNVMLDLSSGVEENKGEKSSQLISQFFNQCRMNYAA
ncbi:bifunctional indole-3-glycerol-phosphate synthase TrpC/phosphoribosylanthranilate isomerase TrpF [Pleionea mediterranea]|uniref:Multifunctional fusion protein n=1 Tax=Pleionea mediterranea TaxID=523701 RepID=A0A316FQW2_9GAMM|nr:bifunctional indole-3-glycerol-phosphate synthase TrpC/phosphoribosylanthranilate isomerase TrpF [Pleionea mediterranea]PWK50106.1 indole-3-glycerol phosphate synthase [Pleionea mediterranea]